MKKYKVVSGCQIEGKPYKVGDVVELNDRLADKLKSLSTPRIEEYVEEKPKRGRPKKAEENRAIGLPGAEDEMETR